jgi:LCP family protein required for cell wall assembly
VRDRPARREDDERVKSTDSRDDDEVQRPLPPRLDPRGGHPRTPGSSGTGRRSGAAIAARVIGAALAVIVLGSSGWGWYLERVAEASVNRSDAIPTTGNKDTSGQGAAMNLLLVGDDSRDDLSAAQQAQLHAFDDGGSLNTDTMMLLHVPADGSRATFVSFPRDSYVQIPGYGWDKLNAAFADGFMNAPTSLPRAQREAAGQQLLVQTISQLTGLQIDHFASVDLLGFFNLSNVVGGVQVNLCQAVNDPYSGARFPAGVQTISGADALKFVRQRHGLLRGDLDRVVRQQVFLGGVARKIVSDKMLLNLGKQQQLVQAVAKSLTVDTSLDLMQLAQQMRSVTAGGVTFQTMPIVGDAKDDKGRDILRLADVDTLHEWFAKLSADPAPAPPGKNKAPHTTAAPQTLAPSAVTVQVFNGSGRTGLAASTASGLQKAGFVIGSTGNADAATYTKTEIRYAAGDQALANTLATTVKGATLSQRSGVTPGTVQLIIGSDFTAVGQPLTPVTTSTEATPTDTPRTAADTTCIN